MARGTINKVILVGYLGQNPVLRYMPNGNPVLNISMSTTETWKDKKTGERQERTDWHRLVFFNGLANTVAEYLKKGAKIYIEGSNRTRKYEKNGEDRYITEVICHEMQMMDRKPKSTLPEFPSEIPAASEDELTHYESLAESTGHSSVEAEA